MDFWTEKKKYFQTTVLDRGVIYLPYIVPILKRNSLSSLTWELHKAFLLLFVFFLTVLILNENFGDTYLSYMGFTSFYLVEFTQVILSKFSGMKNAYK